MKIPNKHFNDMTPEEQRHLLSRLHPSVLRDGIWVSPGAPTEEELEFWRNLPGADEFRRRFFELAQQRINREGQS